MLALFSQLVRWLKPDGVRALKKIVAHGICPVCWQRVQLKQNECECQTCSHSAFLGTHYRANFFDLCPGSGRLDISKSLSAETPVRRETPER
jgi:hypothetical protein